MFGLFFFFPQESQPRPSSAAPASLHLAANTEVRPAGRGHCRHERSGEDNGYKERNDLLTASNSE